MVKCGICKKNVGSGIEYHLNRFHPETIVVNDVGGYRRRAVRGSRRPIVVDGNNVAYYGGSPRVRNLKSCRTELLRAGFDPHVVVSEALIHQIDDCDELLRLQRLGWVVTAESDEVDDIEVIEAGMRFGCEIVSNDRFLDHRGRYAGRYDFSKLRRFRFVDGKFSLE